jgi:hypothetical protein
MSQIDRKEREEEREKKSGERRNRMPSILKHETLIKFWCLLLQDNDKRSRNNLIPAK